MTKKEFIQLYDSYFDTVSRFLSYYTLDKSELEDLIQEVFLRLWKYRDTIDFSNKYIKSYLLKTARNVALTSIFEKDKELVVLDSEIEQYAEVKEDVAVMSYKNFYHDYEQALNQSPSKAKMVYLMSREDGYTYNEIAQTLQISPKTVEAHISKVLRSLRKQLTRYQF